ncbi:MAG: hypothetical protein Q7S04_03905 [Candidatus Moranbacteria bacterium]|nr:hypothetical protein [Candidatus Moranbacteria bacterium]
MEHTIPFPATTIKLENGIILAYGENRDQSPAWLVYGGTDDPLAPSRFKWESGQPSFISIADLAQITDIQRLLVESFQRFNGRIPYIVIAGKHGNPCGTAISYEHPHTALGKALMGDTVAVMGGEVITNFPIGDDEAQILLNSPQSIGREKWGLDLIAAPEFSPGAVAILGKKQGRRLLSNPSLHGSPFSTNQWVVKPAGADWLCQRTPSFILTRKEVQSWSGKEMNSEQFENALIAFACCWRASSNTVALAKDRMLIGLGCGQQDRIACVRLCLDRAYRAGHDTRGSIFASDGFFPYAKSTTKYSDAGRQTLIGAMQAAQITLNSRSVEPDFAIKVMANLSALISSMDRREGTELLIDAGCRGGIVPADGKELPNVRDLFEKSGLAVGFVAPEHRGFSKH